MRIVVTGGAGFIGSNIVDFYINEGHDVFVIDDLSSGKKKNIHSKAQFYQLDIRSEAAAKIIQEIAPDVINHHAAQKSVPKSVEDPALDADINIMGLINLLNAAIKANVKKVIFASSGGALSGNSEIIPAPETANPSLISPYAITKYMSEKYLDFYAITHGLKYTVLRYSNVYGPRQIPEGECGVIPIFMDNLLHGRPSTLYTYDDMPQGTTRDYVYVDDVAHANLLALTKGDNEIFNIGTGNEITIGGIYDILLKVSGSELPLIRAKERVGDVKRSALNADKAYEIMGWKAEMGTEEGVRITYKEAEKDFNTK